jgi:hypothetical protein
MNHPDLMHYGNLALRFAEIKIATENKTTLIIHCIGCGKFKSKKSTSKYCRKCLGL